MKKILIILLCLIVLAFASYLFLNYRQNAIENLRQNSGINSITYHVIDYTQESKQDNYKTAIVYPQFLGINNTSAQEKIDTDVKNSVLAVANKFKEDAKTSCNFSNLGPAAPDWQCELDTAFDNFQLVRNKILSIEMQYYQFTGGAHGGTNYVFYNYSLETGEEINWQDVFKNNPNYLKEISEYSYSNLKTQLTQGENPLSQDGWVKQGTDPIADNYNTNVGFTADGLKIIFQQYQVAPYSTGPQTLIIPYSALNLSL